MVGTFCGLKAILFSAKPLPAGAFDNSRPFFEPQPTNHHSPATNHPPATLHEQPIHRLSSTTTQKQLTDQVATLQQQPAHQLYSDNRPCTTDRLRTDQVTKFAPSASPVDVQQTPEIDMDTSSD